MKYYILGHVKKQKKKNMSNYLQSASWLGVKSPCHCYSYFRIINKYCIYRGLMSSVLMLNTVMSVRCPQKAH